MHRAALSLIVLGGLLQFAGVLTVIVALKGTLDALAGYTGRGRVIGRHAFEHATAYDGVISPRPERSRAASTV